MKLVSTAELKTKANKLLRWVEEGRKPIVVTRRGKPCAVLEPCSEDDLEALAYEYGPEILKMAKESATDMKRKNYITLEQFAKKHGLA